MVRSQTLPFNDYAVATSGQLAWVYINQLIDYDERVRKIHVHCLPEFQQDRCEVCGKPIFDLSKLPDEIQKEVYRPGEDGAVKTFTWTREKTEVFGDGGQQPEIEVDV